MLRQRVERIRVDHGGAARVEGREQFRDEVGGLWPARDPGADRDGGFPFHRIAKHSHVGGSERSRAGKRDAHCFRDSGQSQLQHLRARSERHQAGARAQRRLDEQRGGAGLSRRTGDG